MTREKRIKKEKWTKIGGNSVMRDKRIKKEKWTKIGGNDVRRDKRIKKIGKRYVELM